jgi:hypothetical protein
MVQCSNMLDTLSCTPVCMYAWRTLGATRNAALRVAIPPLMVYDGTTEAVTCGTAAYVAIASDIWYQVHLVSSSLHFGLHDLCGSWLSSRNTHH